MKFNPPQLELNASLKQRPAKQRHAVFAFAIFAKLARLVPPADKQSTTLLRMFTHSQNKNKDRSVAKARCRNKTLLKSCLRYCFCCLSLLQQLSKI